MSVYPRAQTCAYPYSSSLMIMTLLPAETIFLGRRAVPG
jgi:hypothetical protein